MTPRQVTKTPRARLDLVEIAASIGERNEDAAYRFLRAAGQAFITLAEFPGMGARREARNPKLLGLRSWPITGFGNYLVFYTPTRRGIRVIRVLHGARDLRAILGPDV
jgi:toxin ParE1/3/4